MMRSTDRTCFDHGDISATLSRYIIGSGEMNVNESVTTSLGVSAYHTDSAACLVRNGELIVAAEEERCRCIKHWAEVPMEAFRYCLTEAGLLLGDLDRITRTRYNRPASGGKEQASGRQTSHSRNCRVAGGCRG